MPLPTVTVKCPHCHQEHAAEIPAPPADPRPRDVRLLCELLEIFRDRDELRATLTVFRALDSTGRLRDVTPSEIELVRGTIQQLLKDPEA